MTDYSLEFSVVAVVIATAAAVTSWLQYRTGRRVALLSVFSEITDHTADREVRRARHRLAENPALAKLMEEFYNPPPIESELPELDKATELDLVEVSAAYDRVGFALSLDPGLKPDFLDYHGGPVIHMWALLGRLVKERYRTKLNPRHGKYFEWLALEALKYESDLNDVRRVGASELTAS
jgi:hypothetical protein